LFTRSLHTHRERGPLLSRRLPRSTLVRPQRGGSLFVHTRVGPSGRGTSQMLEAIMAAALATSSSPLIVRGYVASDFASLESMCKDVYGGLDYLPSMASAMAADPQCRLLVLHDEEYGKIVAIANYRRLSSHLAWLEGVRVDPSRQGAGLATKLTMSHVELARAEKCQLLSATVASNSAMRAIFAKAGMAHRFTIQIALSSLATLPGWAPPAHGESPQAAQPLLRALGLEEAIDADVRALAASFEPVKNAESLVKALGACEAAGASGIVPGLWTVLSDETLAGALRDGRCFCLPPGDQEGDQALPACVFVLIEDAGITSLRSRLVCCVATASDAALTAALFRASDVCGEQPFALAFDGAVPIDVSGSTAAALPLQEDTCLCYGRLPEA
jgi:GNAT superfamily N-acetyltransferase